MGLPKELRPAVFLDRDEVINTSKRKDITDRPLTPLKPADMIIFSFVGRCIKELNRLGFLVFIITNQPAVAKGQMNFDDLQQMHAMIFHHVFIAGGELREIYVCPHHPDPNQVVVEKLLLDCDCRMPKPGMILRARDFFKIDLENSWVVGNSRENIEAGKKAGCRTILIKNQFDVSQENICQPGFRAKNLEEAVTFISEKKTLEDAFIWQKHRNPSRFDG